MGHSLHVFKGSVDKDGESIRDNLAIRVKRRLSLGSNLQKSHKKQPAPILKLLALK